MDHVRAKGTGRARRLTLADVAEQLRELRALAGSPSYAEIARRIGHRRGAEGRPPAPPARATVYDCFRTDRRRLDVELVVEIVRALGGDDAEDTRFRHMCAAAQRHADAASVVTIRTSLDGPGPAPFVGRRAELTAIQAVLGAPGTGPRGVWIEGMPGAGKTALAMRAAHHVLEDGVAAEAFVVDLRGFHTDSPPADPGSVVDGLLRVVGVRPRDLPAGDEARRALLSERLAERRALLLLDDASGPEQVAPFTSLGPGVVLIVTSRVTGDDRLVRVPVGPLRSDESIALLRAVAGAVADSDPATAADLVDVAGGLPLAVELAASRVAARPSWTLAEHLEPLRRRLQAYRLDDAVQASLALSYAALSDNAKEVLRLLAAQPFPEVDDDAVAALSGAAASGALDELRRHHLVLVPRPGTYALHALVRTFALDRSDDEDRPTYRAAALERLAEHYAAMVWATYWALAATDGHWVRRPRIALTVPSVTDTQARAWLDDNEANVFLLAQYAPELGRPDIATTISEGAAWWLSWYSRLAEARLLHGTAARVAEHVGDTVGEAWARYDLARVLSQMNYVDETQAELFRIDTLDVETDDPGFRALVDSIHAQVEARLGRYDEAIERLMRATEVHRRTDNPQRLTAALGNIAILHQLRGDLPSARHFHQLVHDEAVRSGDRRTRAIALGNIAAVHADLGDHAAALAAAKEGHALSTELEFDRGVALAMINIGCATHRLGHHDDAVDWLTRGHDLARRLGLRHEDGIALVNLGEAHLARGDLDAAHRAFDAGRELSRATGEESQEVRCLVGLGDTLLAQEDRDAARECWHAARELAERAGLTAPEDLDLRLREVGQPASGGS